MTTSPPSVPSPARRPAPTVALSGLLIDGLLIAGFGGPEVGHCCGRRSDCGLKGGTGCSDAAACFVSGILGDDPTKQARIDEVAAHYRHLGGSSPYNALTQRQVEALETALEQAPGCAGLPVALGLRHWSPWIVDAVRALAARGVRELGVLILSVHQSSVGWDDYLALADAACATVRSEGGDIRLARVAQPVFDAPAYAKAIADRMVEATAGWDAERRAAAVPVFTAHAIPVPAESRSPYRRQIDETVRLATAACRARGIGTTHDAVLAFQSHPPVSAVPWSQPALSDVLDRLAAEGVRDVIVQPCGFLVDHVEVLYDLDHDAAEQAQRVGLGWARAGCVQDHPAFIALLAERVGALTG